tara:strand:- start:252 stop:479 length:228 start_codon:yes stop_codon:yes gene_type:complete
MKRTLCIVVASAALMAIPSRVARDYFEQIDALIPMSPNASRFFTVQYDDKLLSPYRTELVSAPSEGLSDYSSEVV